MNTPTKPSTTDPKSASSATTESPRPVSAELRDYIERYEKATGHKPLAMPVTNRERWLLLREWIAEPMAEISEGVDQFMGVDLYFDERAKELRLA